MGWIENSGIGDYSYIKLLRVMEALENEDEAVAQDMDQDDEELMTTLEEWCAKFTSSLQSEGLPDDLFSIPGEIRPVQSNMGTGGKEVIVGEV
jgi:hypothetical protein